MRPKKVSAEAECKNRQERKLMKQLMDDMGDNEDILHQRQLKMVLQQKEEKSIKLQQIKLRYGRNNDG